MTALLRTFIGREEHESAKIVSMGRPTHNCRVHTAITVYIVPILSNPSSYLYPRLKNLSKPDSFTGSSRRGYVRMLLSTRFNNGSIASQVSTQWARFSGSTSSLSIPS